MKLHSIGVLLSAGMNPANGRMRRSPIDAQALELVLMLREVNPAVTLEAIHIGDMSNEPALREYMGMGLEAVTLLEQGPGSDPVALLSDYLQSRNMDLIVAGCAALDAGASGVFPYQLSQALAIPVLPDVTALVVTEHALVAKQARERGVRQNFEIGSPAIITVSPLAPSSRLPAYVRARAGTITTILRDDHSVMGQAVPALRGPTLRPSAPMRKALASADPNATAEERLRAVTALKDGAGDLHEGMQSEQIASEILARLKQVGLHRSKTSDFATGVEK